LISSIFRVKKSNPKSNLKPACRQTGSNRNALNTVEITVLNLNLIFEPVCRQAGLGFKTIKTKNDIEVINPTLLWRDLGEAKHKKLLCKVWLYGSF
jgi:hypothetical protein